MKLKNTVSLNRIPVSYDIILDYAKAHDYHLKHGVEWIDTFKIVDIKGYTSTFNAYSNRWLVYGTENLITLDPNADVNTFVFDMNEWATPTGSQYPLKPNTPNGCCYVVGSKPYITIGAYPTPPDQTWIEIAHERMHALVRMAVAKGFYIQDVMDTYKENNNPDSPTGNFAEQWKLLQPYLNSVKSPLEATLTRLYDYGRETVGKLVVGDGSGFVCNTLELGWKANQTNISSIPTGRYLCKWTFSPKFMRYTYEITSVPNRSGIRIHSASIYSSLLGCLALGRGYGNLDLDGLPDLYNSRKTILEFETLMAKRDFTLIVK